MQEPKWATDLIGEVCSYYGRRTPTVRWVKRHRNSTSGRTYMNGHKKGITMCMGSDPKDHRNVLLHELAHYISPRGWHHNVKFWTKAWEIHFLFGEDFLYTKKREFSYMKKARNGYYRHLAWRYE